MASLTSFNTDQGAQFTDVLGQEVSEICFTSLLHHIVASAVTKKYQKDRGNIVETLDILESWIFREETIQHFEHISLFLVHSI